MVALTGIEPDGCRFSSVQLGLSSCVFSPVGIPRWSETPPRTADVTAQSQRSRGPGVDTGEGRRPSKTAHHHARPGPVALRNHISGKTVTMNCPILAFLSVPTFMQY